MSGPADHDQDLYASSEGDHLSDDDLDALSPADGYFRASVPPPNGDDGGLDSQLAQRGPMSSNVPHVPNVMVEDPTLRQDSAQAKAQEAAEEASNDDGQEDHSESVPTPEVGPTESQPVDATAPISSPSVVDAHQSTSSPIHSPTSPRLSEQTTLPQSTSSPVLSPTSPRGPDQTPWSQMAARQLPAQRARPTRRNDRRIYSDAPPAYSPGPSASYGAIAPCNSSSPSSPLLPQDTSSAGEQQPLLSAFPQSMASHLPQPETTGWPWKQLHWTAGNEGFKKRAVVALAAAVTILTILVVTVGLLLSRHRKDDYVEEPIKRPNLPIDGPMPWNPLPGCLVDSIFRIDVGHSFDYHAGRNLTILQVLEDREDPPGGRAVRTFGEIVFRPARDSVGYFSVESISNSPELGISLGRDSRSEAIKVSTRSDMEWQGGLDPCIQVRITVLIPPDGLLRVLDIQAQKLDIKIEEGLSVTVTESASFLTFQGDITSPEKSTHQNIAPYRLDSPVIEIQSTEGTVRGWYPLYKWFLAGTTNGDISVRIGHKLLKYGGLQRSMLDLQSAHGNIEATELSQSSAGNGPGDRNPRDHIVEIETISGDIHAETLYSSSASFKSTSGNVNVSVSPASERDCLRWGYQFCSVETHVIYGTTDIFINAPPSPPESAPEPDASHTQQRNSGSLSALRSTHGSRDGSIVARYPSSWEGNIIASTLYGEMEFIGEGLVMKRWDAINKRMLGKKGHGTSTMIISTAAGNQKIIVGDERDDNRTIYAT